MAPIDDENMRILIATDIHLGFGEKWSERANDSFNSFDELLEIGKENNVDLGILGGDLYHDNKPTRSAQIKCTKILTKHIFGPEDIFLEYLSNPYIDFSHCASKTVNYEDPNMNICLPIFSIHGNHDDPSGLDGFSCLDLLHENKLVNYFGKVENLKEIHVRPVLLRKNGVCLALYGLSSVKDERLHRLLRENKVIFETPDVEEDWFYILVLHQNRAKRGPTNYIPEHFLPQFFHLVIWGHEHDCRIEPEENELGVFVTQPGSPVATSLCEGEAITKKVGILTINRNREFKLTPIPLQTVRPLIFKTVSLASDFENLDPKDTKDDDVLRKRIERELTHTVEDMIQEAEELLTGHPMQGKLPLIRLRVEYTNERQQFNPIRFGNAFYGKVANTTDMILFKRRAFAEEPTKKEEVGSDEDDLFVPPEMAKNMADYINDIIQEEGEDSKLSLLSVKGLNSAVDNYIHKADNDAIKFITRKQLERRQAEVLAGADFEEETEIERVIEDLGAKIDEEEEARIALQELNAPGRKRNKAVDRPMQVENSDSEEVDDNDYGRAAAAPPRRNGAANQRNGGGAANGSSRRGATASRNKMMIDSDDDDEKNSFRTREPSPPKPARGGRGSRARGARGRAAAASAARGKGQTTIMSAFASQSQRVNSTLNSSVRSSQRNRKQQFESDSD